MIIIKMNCFFHVCYLYSSTVYIGIKYGYSCINVSQFLRNEGRCKNGGESPRFSTSAGPGEG